MKQRLLETLQKIWSDMLQPISYIPHGIIIGVMVVIATGIYCYFGRKTRVSWHQQTALFLLAIYFTVFTELTFLSREPGSRTGRDWTLFTTWGDQTIPDAYFIENILLCIPLGILLPLRYRKFRRMRSCVLAGMLFSILLEFLQLITQRGHCQLDDVVTNTLGTAIGYWNYKLLIKRIQ